MDNKYIILTILAGVMTSMLCIPSGNCASSIDVDFDEKYDLYQYENVYIDVQNTQYKTLKEKRNGRGTSWVAGEIRNNLRDMGFELFYYDNIENPPKETDLILNAFIKYSWGVPEFVRHFKVVFKFIKSIEIQFVDAKTEKTICKIFYDRSYFHKEDNEISAMFKELKKLTGK